MNNYQEEEAEQLGVASGAVSLGATNNSNQMAANGMPAQEADN